MYFFKLLDTVLRNHGAAKISAVLKVAAKAAK